MFTFRARLYREEGEEAAAVVQASMLVLELPATSSQG
jgi:hypothetical protein